MLPYDSLKAGCVEKVEVSDAGSAYSPWLITRPKVTKNGTAPDARARFRVVGVCAVAHARQSEALGALKNQKDVDEEPLISVAAWNAPVVERQESCAVKVLFDALRQPQATEGVKRPAGPVEAMRGVPS